MMEGDWNHLFLFQNFPYKKFSDEKLDAVFKEKPEDIYKDTEFGSKFCEKNI